VNLIFGVLEEHAHDTASEQSLGNEILEKNFSQDPSGSFLFHRGWTPYPAVDSCMQLVLERTDVPEKKKTPSKLHYHIVGTLVGF
jgi:hypothetical protein